MSTKHTPGPWTRGEGDSQSVLSEIGWECVAQANDGLPNMDANARLIASAPDLLEALKELVDANDDAAHPQWKGSPVENMARAAIAKATGESA